MIAFRKAHPSLCRSRFWREDIRWYGTVAAPDLSPGSRTLAFCLHGGSEGDDDLYVMINGSMEDRGFSIQDGRFEDWSRVVDTALPSPDDIREPGEEIHLSAQDYEVRGRSVVVLRRRRA
jgi:glycogen operon protein